MVSNHRALTTSGWISYLDPTMDRADHGPLILVTNDDGIEAAGIKALESTLPAVGTVWVVAPSGERSTSSHCITLRDEIGVRQVGPRSYAVDGWPADATYLGLFALLPRRPDLVVSGINLGPNLGTDVIYSGTVGAAMEAFGRGISAMALSLVDGDDFGHAAKYAAALASAMIGAGHSSSLLNVNVPGATSRGVRVAALGRRIYPEIAKLVRQDSGTDFYRIGGGILGDAELEGSDGEAIAAGYISVTPLGLDSMVHADRAAATALARQGWESHQGTNTSEGGPHE